MGRASAIAGVGLVVAFTVALLYVNQGVLGESTTDLVHYVSTDVAAARAAVAPGVWRLEMPSGAPQPAPGTPFVPYADAMAAVAARGTPAAASVNAATLAPQSPVIAPDGVACTLEALRTTLDTARGAARCAAPTYADASMQKLFMSLNAVRERACEFGGRMFAVPPATHARLLERPVKIPTASADQCTHGHVQYNNFDECEHENLLYTSKADCAVHVPGPAKSQWLPFAVSVVAGSARWGGATHTEPFAIYARDAFINGASGGFLFTVTF